MKLSYIAPALAAFLSMTVNLASSQEILSDSDSDDSLSSSGNGNGMIGSICRSGSNCSANLFCYKGESNQTCQSCLRVSAITTSRVPCRNAIDADGNCAKCTTLFQCVTDDQCKKATDFSGQIRYPLCSNTTRRCTSRNFRCDPCWNALRSDINSGGGVFTAASSSACSAIPDVASKCSDWSSVETSLDPTSSSLIKNAFHTQGFVFSPSEDEGVLFYTGYYLPNGSADGATVESVSSWSRCITAVYNPPSDAPLNSTIFTVDCPRVTSDKCEDRRYAAAVVKIYRDVYRHGRREFAVAPTSIFFEKMPSESCDTTAVARALALIIGLSIFGALAFCALVAGISGGIYYCCCRSKKVSPPSRGVVQQQQPPAVVVVERQFSQVEAQPYDDINGEPVQGQVVEMKYVE